MCVQIGMFKRSLSQLKSLLNLKKLSFKPRRRTLLITLGCITLIKFLKQCNIM